MSDVTCNLFDAIDVATSATPDQLLAIDDALAKLAVDDPAAAKLVELRYFAGMSNHHRIAGSHPVLGDVS